MGGFASGLFDFHLIDLELELTRVLSTNEPEAAQVAAVLTGRAERSATVELRGGNLEIEWRERGPEANHVFMTGEAVEVFKGEVEVGDDELVSAE